ncbi:MAG: ComEC/Rec2 family competence protein [Campylobacterota bacterium]
MFIRKYKIDKVIILIFSLSFFVFIINLSIYYAKYQEIVYEELFEAKAQIVNIYDKQEYNVLKFKSENFTFFSSFEKRSDVKKYDVLKVAFITTNLTFIDFLKGFYVNTVFYEKQSIGNNIWKTLRNYSDSQHHNEMIQELYQALFFANPIGEELRQICANYGISHLVALSGFHLAVLSFIIYFTIYYPYSFFHKRYFPYRNRKFDILLITLFFLFVYLLFTGLVASLTRAFVMMALGIYLLRSDIKIFSFTTLFLIFAIVVALFPNYLFSLSLWFSIFGVFYIFLFIRYFNNIKNRVFQILLFNFWIYLAMNPIVHYFFDVTSFAQLLSPFITIAFTVFYPFELFAHLLGFGGILDGFLDWFLTLKVEVFKISTPFWFFILFLGTSFLAIAYKTAFTVLNILLIGFTLFMYI